MHLLDEDIQRYKLILEEEEGREFSLEEATKIIEHLQGWADLIFDDWWSQPETQKKYMNKYKDK